MLENRNDVCWCGSGKKYKKCHLAFDERLKLLEVQGHEIPPRNIIKTAANIEGIRKSGLINNKILDFISDKIKPGISTEQINEWVHHYTLELGGIPAPLNYNGFPKSVCTSLNNVVCHGIPSKDIFLEDGDILNIDITTIVDGYFADASRMFMIGDVSAEDKRLVQVAKECLDIGIAAIKPWGFLGDIGAAVAAHAHANGCTVVRDLGGHGVGNLFHEEPYVTHVGEKGTGMLLVPGMVLTVEPMINAGGYEVFVDEDDEWTVYTADDSYSAQWEHTVLITDTGVEILAY